MPLPVKIGKKPGLFPDRVKDMEKAVYSFTVWISKGVGYWFFNLVAKIIATGYFLLFPDRVKNSVIFYRALIPGKRLPYYLWCTWRQYQNFTKVFLDRIMFLEADKISYSSTGWHHLEQGIKNKEGGIILMSHVGNWEVAAHLLRKRNQDVRLLLYLGTKHKEQIEKMQKESLASTGTKIIAVDQNGGSPFLLIESIKWMNEGGLVSLTGDIIWTREQKAVTVDFLGQKAQLPETPFMLALLSGRPLYIMFALPNGKHHLSVNISPPVRVIAQDRKDRKDAVQRAAQQYADMLMKTIHDHPFEWFHFERFVK